MKAWEDYTQWKKKRSPSKPRENLVFSDRRDENTKRRVYFN